MKYILFDLKRVFENKVLIIICIISPIITMLLFGSIIAPLLFTAKITKFNVAIINEDKSVEVNTFLNQMLNSQALEDLVVAYPAETIEDAMQMLENQDVLIVIHIPKQLLDSIRLSKKTYIDLYSQKGHDLEIALIKMTLNSSLSTVEKGQNLIEYSTQFLLQKNISQGKLETFISDITTLAINEFMSRRAILSQEGMISPIGEYLPIEYYIGAIFTFFAALAMIPIAGITSRDMQNNVLQRGFLWSERWRWYFIGRVLSGVVLISLIILLVYPATMLSSILNMALKMEYTSNILALFLAAILSAICYSSMAITIGSIFCKGNLSIWIIFYLVIFMSVLCGAIIPNIFMPNWINAIGVLLPFRASMRSITSAIFLFDKSQYYMDIFKLCLWTCMFLCTAFFSMRKRGHAK